MADGGNSLNFACSLLSTEVVTTEQPIPESVFFPASCIFARSQAHTKIAPNNLINRTHPISNSNHLEHSLDQSEMHGSYQVPSESENNHLLPGIWHMS